MSAATMEKLEKDELAMSVAQALALANEAALGRGIVPADSLVTISEETTATGRIWRIHYGPRNFINRRGGDLIVLVDEKTWAVQRIMHGQ